MVTGGLLMESMTDAQRGEAGLDASKLALRVQHVGQYGEHATAKNAGFLKDDIVVAWDGVTDNVTESDLIVRTLEKRAAGAVIPVTVMRGGQRKSFELQMK